MYWTAKKRIIQREQAKRTAIFRGTWVDKTEDNSCACCFKEDRESSKRAVRTRHERGFFKQDNVVDVECGSSLEFRIACGLSK